MTPALRIELEAKLEQLKPAKDQAWQSLQEMENRNKEQRAAIEKARLDWCNLNDQVRGLELMLKSQEWR